MEERLRLKIPFIWPLTLLLTVEICWFILIIVVLKFSTERMRRWKQYAWTMNTFKILTLPCNWVLCTLIWLVTFVETSKRGIISHLTQRLTIYILKCDQSIPVILIFWLFIWLLIWVNWFATLMVNTLKFLEIS